MRSIRRFPAGRAAVLAVLAASTMVGQQSQFQGSVPTGTASSTPLALTLHDAIARGLKTNLGLLVSDSASETVRGQRLQALSALLPQVHAQAGETIEQLNLKTVGFNFYDPGRLRAHNCWTVSLHGRPRLRLLERLRLQRVAKDYRSAQENKRAAQLSVADARDLVVQATASAYLQIIADASRIDAIRSQVQTAQALYDRAVDQQNAGTAAGIDVLRSQVELRQQQQRLAGSDEPV